MIDYNKKIQELTKEIIDFTFEYDFEEVKSKMQFIGGNWQITEDIITPQLKKYIRNQLSDTMDYGELQKALMVKDLQNKSVIGKVGGLDTKISTTVASGKFYIHATTSPEKARQRISEVITEIHTEKAPLTSTDIAKKSFKWQKWGIIIATIIGVIAVIVAIIHN
jgi:hypothetical protein